jgi:DNA repair protein RadC
MEISPFRDRLEVYAFSTLGASHDRLQDRPETDIRPKASPSQRQITLKELLKLQSVAPMNELNSSLATFENLKHHYNPFAEEVWVLALNAQLKIMQKEMIFRGTVDHCLIHPRDIFRFLIQANASSFIMAHNHPSEDVLPSDSDLIITRKFFRMAQLFEMPLLDHVIFTNEKYFSMADHGFMKKWKRNSFIR